jgi:hypothetical protein
LNLTINDTTFSNTNAQACYSYTWNGNTYNASGTYTYATVGAQGCDSIATLNLTINDTTFSSTNAQSCYSYTWNGNTYNASGTYTYATVGSQGCDSIATLNLTINDTTFSSTNAQSCYSYTWNGNTYNASGTYTFATIGSQGCDSIATLNLTINDTTFSNSVISACDSYLWNGNTYTTSGTYTYTTIGAQGCDSIATLDLTINTTLTADIVISTTTPNVCAGVNILFTTTLVNEGSNPQFDWQINGVSTGVATSTFASSVLQNSDVVSCILTSSETCASNPTDTSAGITVNITPIYTPSIVMNASSTIICQGSSVTFTAYDNNGGNVSIYEWYKNGILTFNLDSVYNVNNLVNGDVITCKITTTESCATQVSDTAVPVTIIVNQLASPAITITPTNATICIGNQVTFSSSVSNQGSNPAYQWLINGNAVSGQTGSNFTTSNLQNGDIVTCNLTSNATCVNPSNVVSNSVVMTVSNNTLPEVSIASAAGTVVCNGTSVMFIATPVIGTSPSYQWLLNGSPVAGATSNLFTPTTLNNNDSVRCLMTANSPCGIVSTVSSSMLVMNVLPNVVASISIATNTNNVCQGTEVTFNAIPGAGITNPLFQWRINGVNIPQAIDSEFRTKELNNNDVVSAILFSSYECLSSNNVASNNVIMSVNSNNFNLDFTSDTQAPAPGTSFAVTLSNTTTNTTNKSFTWYFGDGSSYDGLNPNTHLYPSDGLYTVALRARDTQTGCVDSISKTNYISCVGGPVVCGQTVSVSPSGNTINGCVGGSITMRCTTNAVNQTYQWNKNGIILGGETDDELITTSPGSYSVTVYSSGGCPVTSVAKQLTFNQAAPNAPIITSSGTLMGCVQDSITLTVSGSFANYLWNTGDTAQSIIVKQSGIYSAIGFNNDGCNRQADPIAVNNSFVEAPAICMVTVDSVTGENLLVWEKPITNLIDSFIIYKEVSPFVYKRIISQPYSALSEVIDTASNPSMHDDVYKLVAVDTCGNFTLPSVFHRTIHLQINPGIGTSRVLSWNNEAGFVAPGYIVMRGKPGQMVQIDTISSTQNSYIDNPDATTLANNDTCYRIDVLLPSGGCNSTKSMTVRVRSTSNNSSNRNLAISGVGINDAAINESIEFYPNPVESSLLVKNYNNQLISDIYVFSLIGAAVDLPIVKTTASSAQIDCSSLTQGIYVLQIGNTYRKFVKK